MKVVYEKGIMERLREARSESVVANKKIEYIEVTEKEGIEIYDYSMSTFLGHYCPRQDKCISIHNGMIYGIKIKVEGCDD
jgi:hypothetical protein